MTKFGVTKKEILQILANGVPIVRKYPPISHALTLGERWRIWKSRQKEDANANAAQRRY